MTTLITDPHHGRALIWQRALQRWLTRSSVDEILPSLYLGGSYAASNLHLLASKNITFVLTIMSKDLPQDVLQQYSEKGIEHHFVQKRDTDDENLLEVFGELCHVMEEKLRRGGEGTSGEEKHGVLVHCAMGISRSVSVVLAYVMQRYGISRSEAKRLVRAKRNVANPNAGFYHQLKVWEACRYDIRTVWSIDGVKQLKLEYQTWMGEREEERRKKQELENREGEGKQGGEGEGGDEGQGVP